jgi:hypothetical protein
MALVVEFQLVGLLMDAVRITVGAFLLSAAATGLAEKL